ncbi:hypothetical protein HBB16_18380 [Pseudonocardia sp. MCCB 268]|nr:hypothetical protein [Pseudonocardia cytotoxica]
MTWLRRSVAGVRPDQVVVRRRFRQQRAFIPAFMEPRSCVVDLTGEQLTFLAATQVLQYPAHDDHGDPRRPGVQVACHRPGRRRLRRQDRRAAPRRCFQALLAQKLELPVKDRRPAASACSPRTTGLDQIQDLVMHRLRGRHHHRLRRPPHADARCIPGPGWAGRADPGAFMFNAIYKIPALKFTCSNVFTNKTLTDRPLRGRPPGGHLRDELDDGRSSPSSARLGPD